ncbi:urokinase plasminogen activator surface receptor isoform X2 [Ictalurus punctatus]|uniref:Urokinase plasminogen activator surface receptor isoform X2 n=1 Tax=Ictalurus punctatus TaxID=7998 RepID=A0A2D0SJQ8_ICTPU|nr:urokinase plasminogen activator surface receptor isoform X2 [Ictalurus punctatus]
MKLSIMLLLIFMLSSEVLSLMCQKCIPSGITPCTRTQITCPDKCLSATVSVSSSGTDMNVNLQTCGTSSLCVNESMNVGIMNIATNVQCCITDLCNNRTPAAPAQQFPNGKSCFTCVANRCSGTVNCVGNQDFCISASVQQGNNALYMKGCATKSACDASAGVSSQQGVAPVNVQCCAGNLCNSAEIFTLSFFLMIVPLICSILFH